jgi:hypothetical protein
VNNSATAHKVPTLPTSTTLAGLAALGARAQVRGLVQVGRIHHMTMQRLLVGGLGLTRRALRSLSGGQAFLCSLGGRRA